MAGAPARRARTAAGKEGKAPMIHALRFVLVIGAIVLVVVVDLAALVGWVRRRWRASERRE